MNIQTLNKAIPDVHQKYTEKLQALMARIEIEHHKANTEKEMKVLKSLSLAMTATMIAATIVVTAAAAAPVVSAALTVGTVSLGKAVYHQFVEKTLHEKADQLREDYQSGALKKEINKVSLWEKIKEAAKQTLATGKVAENINSSAPEPKSINENAALQAPPEVRQTLETSSAAPAPATNALEQGIDVSVTQSQNKNWAPEALGAKEVGQMFAEPAADAATKAPEFQRDIEMPVPGTASESKSWAEQTKALKEVSQMFAPPAADTDALKAIDIRAEQRMGAQPLAAADKQMAEADVADFQKISEESGLKRFAAVQIADNIKDYPDYKTGFENAASQHPGLSEKVAEFDASNNAAIAAKEDRKAVEMQGMSQNAQSTVPAEITPVTAPELVIDAETVNTNLNEAIPGTASESKSWAEQTKALKEVSQMFAPPAADTDALKAIDIRAEQRAGGLSIVGSDQKMAEADAADFLKISGDSGLQRFAAMQIADNIQDYPDYKTSFESVATQDPGLTEKLIELNAETSAISAAKEDRKAAEMLQGDIEPLPELTPTYRAPTEAETMTFADVVDTEKVAELPSIEVAQVAAPMTAPELVIDASTIERLAALRERDSASTREALGLNTVELNIEKKQQKLAGEAETNRSAWLKKAEDAKAVQVADAPKQVSENKINSDEMFATEKSADVKPVIPPEIESQYLRTGDKFYHPKTPELVAFEDKGHKLETKSDSENISQNLVKIAQARGWDEIKISGSEKFRQEVWLEASARGMEVKGYTPTDLDKAQLAKRAGELAANKIEKTNIPFRGRENEMSDPKNIKPAENTKAEIAKPDSENKRMADTFAKESSVDALKKYPQLAGAVAMASAIDKQAEAAGLTPEQRAIGAARVRQNLTNSIERGDIPPPVKILVPVEVKNEAKEDREFSR